MFNYHTKINLVIMFKDPRLSIFGNYEHKHYSGSKLSPFQILQTLSKQFLPSYIVSMTHLSFSLSVSVFPAAVATLLFCIHSPQEFSLAVSYAPALCRAHSLISQVCAQMSSLQWWLSMTTKLKIESDFSLPQRSMIPSHFLFLFFSVTID